MIMTLSILVIAAKFMVSPASRIKHIPGSAQDVVRHATSAHMMNRTSITRTAGNLPHLRMLLDGLADDDIPEQLSNASTMFAPPSWKANISDRGTSQQIPPYSIEGMETRKLLDRWVDSFVDPYMPRQQKTRLFAKTADLFYQSDGLSPLAEPAQIFQDDKAMVLRAMRDVFIEVSDKNPFIYATTLSRFDRARMIPQDSARSHALYSLLSSKRLEVVALLPEDMEMSFLESGSPAIDRSVLALGVFSRGLLKDDNGGSLREVIEQRYGTEFAARDEKNQFDVFAIDGLADAPGLTEQTARVLLSKIEKYAHQEQKIVVLPRWAYISSERRDLTRPGCDLLDYYVRLGFVKVEMEDGMHEYIYMGSSSSEDSWVENQQVMVGMNTGKMSIADEVMVDTE